MKDGSHVRLLQYRPETVHCSTKDAYTSEITFLALKPWSKQLLKNTILMVFRRAVKEGLGVRKHRILIRVFKTTSVFRDTRQF